MRWITLLGRPGAFLDEGPECRIVPAFENGFSWRVGFSSHGCWLFGWRRAADLRFQGLQPCLELRILGSKAGFERAVFRLVDIGLRLLLQLPAIHAEPGQIDSFEPCQRFCCMDMQGFQLGALGSVDEVQLLDRRSLANDDLAAFEGLIMLVI